MISSYVSLICTHRCGPAARSWEEKAEALRCNALLAQSCIPMSRDRAVKFAFRTSTTIATDSDGIG